MRLALAATALALACATPGPPADQIFWQAELTCVSSEADLDCVPRMQNCMADSWQRYTAVRYANEIEKGKATARRRRITSAQKLVEPAASSTYGRVISPVHEAVLPDWVLKLSPGSQKPHLPADSTATHGTALTS